MVKNSIILIYILAFNFFLINPKKLDISLFQKAASEDCKDISISPNPDNVKFIGRYIIKNEVTWLVQGGSAIEFYLKAKSAEVTLIGDTNVIYQAADQRPRYAVYVNDKVLVDTTIGELEKTIELLKSESENEYKIKIILLSEAANGAIGIKSLKINACSNEQNTIIKPTEKKQMTIEYVGDSITCTYGIESKSAGDPFQSLTENFSLSYAFLSAQRLNADYSGVCYSGSGIIADAAGNAGNLMPKFYTKVSSHGSFGEEWDFEKNKNDIVVINLGTNDFNYVRADPGKREDIFIQEYANFLGLVREKNPEAIIICTIGLMGCEYMLPLIEKGISLFGDKKIKSFLIPAQNPEDGIGAQYHPNYISHQKASVVVANKIKEIIDEIGN